MTEEIRNNRIPTLTYLENNFWTMRASYGWAATIIDFIVDRWGFGHVLRLQGSQHYPNVNFQELFNMSRGEFERQWHGWLRNNFG
jgi:hypothetical protein